MDPYGPQKNGKVLPHSHRYIVVSGTLEYTDSYGEVTMVGEKRIVSEAALWTTWKHRGTLRLGDTLRIPETPRVSHEGERIGNQKIQIATYSEYQPPLNGYRILYCSL